MPYNKMGIAANNKRIAQNTLYLYIRMGLSMMIQLYTSRLVLQNLGVTDYGIYNIVATFIIAFTYISSPMGTATQRFLNFELGKNNDRRVELIFNLSIYIYLFLGIVLFFIIEIIGLWFLNTKMQIPSERLDSANFTFHISILTIIFNLVKTPFESLIIAKEKMSFYAYISIVDVILKLANAMIIVYFEYDKLRLYSINLLVISIVILFCSLFYCRRKFSDVKIKKMWDYSVFREMLGFSGWSLFGSLATMSSNQGLNIVLNLFYGVRVNAAMGIASQVSSSINQFVTNFQIAFRPQIVKYYASGEFSSLHTLICNTSRYSYFLLLGLICPIGLNINFILDKWLGSSPQYASEFCLCMMGYALLETLSAPMWMAIQATGKIKIYQLTISSALFVNIILSYIFLKWGFRPAIVLEIKCILDIVYLYIRICFIRKYIGFPIIEYIKNTLRPVALITIMMISMMLLYREAFYSYGWTYLITSSLVFIVCYVILLVLIGLKHSERKFIIKYINNKIIR